MGGSMGSVVGERFARACDRAADERGVLVSISASGGARMQEGILALMQLPKTVAAVDELHEAGGTLISVLAHPTTGGVTASFASLGDVILAEPGALTSFAGPRVVAQTTREKLPDDFGLAESNLRFGHVDAVVPRPELRADHRAPPSPLRGAVVTQEAELGLRDRLAQLSGVKLLRGTRLSAELERLQRQLERLREDTSDEEIWKRVELARHESRPYTLDYVERILDDWFELHGDRGRMDDSAMVAGIGRLNGQTVALVGHQKGRDLKSRVHRNYGMAYPEGYRKAMRTMALAERHGFPVVTLVDTPGAYPGVAAEQHGQGGAIARAQAVMLRLGVPTVAVVIGEGGSGGAIAIAVADRVLMQENAMYSVISPEGCASILWRDAAQAKKAASAFKPDAAHCLELGVIDGIVPEPEGGAQEDHDAAAALLRDSVVAHLHELADASPGRAPAHAGGRSSARSASSRASERAAALSTLSTGLSPDRKPLVCRDDDQAVTSVLRGGHHLARTIGRWPGSGTTSGSATRAARRSRSAGRPRRARRSSSSSATTPAGSTTTSGWSGTARWRAGPCRRGCRSSQASGTSPSTSRTIRSTTRPSRASSRRASTAPARSRSGTGAPTSCWRRSATAG